MGKESSTYIIISFWYILSWCLYFIGWEIYERGRYSRGELKLDIFIDCRYVGDPDQESTLKYKDFGIIHIIVLLL